MYGKIKEHLSKALSDLKEAGLYKEERIIESPQGAAIQVKGKEVLNFCANNYLGLANHPRLVKASQEMMDRRGFGMASVVPLCYSLAGKSTRVPPSVAISLVSSLSFLGFLGCPPMVGFLSHQFDLRWALSPIVVVGVAIFCLAPLVRRIKA